MMTWKTRGLFLPALLAAVCAAPAAAAQVTTADLIVKESGVTAGLAVHVGTTDGALEADLTNGSKMLVQGLALSDAAAAKSRQYLFDKRVYGLASVSVIKTATALPYYDRIVNLLVADLDALGNDAPSMKEIQRVLGYEGVAYLKKDGTWSKTVKPTPKEVNNWGHARYNASRNGVSKDLVVGPPNAMRWIGGLAGRACLEGPRTSDGVFVQYAPMTGGNKAPWGEGSDNYLWARDINSGVLLWQRKVAAGVEPATASHTSICAGDLFVAAGGRVYTYNLAEDAKTPALTAFNIRTGEIETVFDKSAVFERTADPRSKRATWPRELPMILRLSTVAVEDGKVIQICDGRLYVMDPRSAAVLWKLEPAEGTKYRQVVAGDGLLVALRGGRTWPYDCFQPVALECYRLGDGRPLWTFKDFEPEFSMMNDLNGMSDGYLLLNGSTVKEVKSWKIGGSQTLALFDVRKGAVVWKKPIGAVANQRQFHARIVGSDLWYPTFGFGATAINVLSGEQTDKVSNGCNRGCSGNAATPLYHITQKMFHPLKGTGQPTGDLQYYAFRAINPTCGESLTPSYGSVYCLLNACNCEGWVPGGPQALYAVAPVRPVIDETRLEKPSGQKALPALAKQTAARTAAAAEEWKEPQRLAFMIRRLGKGTDEKGPHAQPWQGYRQETTEPLAAGDLTLAAYVHEHRLAASRGGQEVWNFVAGGRISAAPAIYQHLAIFGAHDGYVYAVNVRDGSLAWRFLAAPADKRHVVVGQVESAWPVFNAVVQEGKVYCAAGRHSDLDGGIHIYCLDAKTGAVQWHVKYVRGLTTNKHTPQTGWMRQGGGKESTYTNTYVINDQIAVRKGKVLLRPDNPAPNATVVLAELADPKDTIISPETLTPPWFGPGAGSLQP
jgi:outer membrane protein assembly factor BamB